ncbi:MAG TPA: SpoIID/LytB domain-containing protein [Nocardioides sp.]|nr:SpoIID/LytB domain-containing protein [Nocardioides sp.]
MRRILIPLALALVTALGGSLTTPSAYAATGPTSVQLAGAGFGHGRGMSQYGAKGMAEAGKTYGDIARFYYPGTSWGTAGGNISVHITEDTTSDVLVAARSGLTLRALTSGRTWNLNRSGARRWRIVPVYGGASSRLLVLTTSWQIVRTVRGQAQFSAGGAPMRLYYPGGSRTYRGVLRSAGGSTRDTVNVVSLETYLRGVVPQEMPALWSRAAVQAQSVAARTYAAYRRQSPLTSRYQICDTSACQVYGGAAAEYPASDAAVKATAGRILTYGGTPAFTEFSASDGGYTVAGDHPYLTAHRDAYDHYPAWTVTLQTAAIEKAYPQLGDFQGIGTIVYDRPDAYGRVETLTLKGIKNGAPTSVSVDGDAFRIIFGLKSTMFHPV